MGTKLEEKWEHHYQKSREGTEEDGGSEGKGWGQGSAGTAVKKQKMVIWTRRGGQSEGGAYRQKVLNLYSKCNWGRKSIEVRRHLYNNT